jgi:uncharacterized protein YbjQ (UPF0145 family)
MTRETTFDITLRQDMTVPATPTSGLAAEAGFVFGDKLVEVQGKPVSSGREIRGILDGLTSTESVSFVVIREKKRLVLGPVPVSASLNGAGQASQQLPSSLGVRHGDSAIPFTTGPSIPGRVTSKVLGLVFGAGNAAWTIEGTSGKAGTALDKASQSLVNEARSIGADAVVSITFSMDGSGGAVNRSQTITLLGTAVRLEATSEPQSAAGRHVSGPES